MSLRQMKWVILPYESLSGQMAPRLGKPSIALTEIMMPVVAAVIALLVVRVLPAINGVLRFFLLVSRSW